MQALAWFGDAMVQHAETFWSLFAVDMDALLEMQPEDTWDSFPLFQMLNDYLRNHGMWNRKMRIPCDVEKWENKTYKIGFFICIYQ